MVGYHANAPQTHQILRLITVAKNEVTENRRQTMNKIKIKENEEKDDDMEELMWYEIEDY